MAPLGEVSTWMSTLMSETAENPLEMPFESPVGKPLFIMRVPPSFVDTGKERGWEQDHAGANS